MSAASAVRAVLVLPAVVLAGCGTIAGIGPQPVIPPGGAGGIAGFVRDESGRPVAHAFVAASCQHATDIQITTDTDGWYDLGQARLSPGRCSIKGGTDDGRFFFGDVTVIAGTSQRVDWTAKQ